MSDTTRRGSVRQGHLSLLLSRCPRLPAEDRLWLYRAFVATGAMAGPAVVRAGHASHGLAASHSTESAAARLNGGAARAPQPRTLTRASLPQPSIWLPHRLREIGCER
jgi:hypothetical protein